jgi:hypothetical protein
MCDGEARLLPRADSGRRGCCCQIGCVPVQMYLVGRDPDARVDCESVGVATLQHVSQSHSDAYWWKLSAHFLEVETMKWAMPRLPRAESVCGLCRSGVGD